MLQNERKGKEYVIMEYRIVEKQDSGKTYYSVEKRFKLWFIKSRWYICKIEVFYGCGMVQYPAIFETYTDAENYVSHKGSLVNGLIWGHYFYQE